MLDTLPKDLVRRNLELHKQLVRESNPDISSARGPFHDIILYYSAIFTTLNQQRVREAIRPLRLGQLLKQADKAPVDLVDAVADNWLLKRQPGSLASGLVTLLFAKPQGLAVQRGTIFHAGNKLFHTDKTYLLRTRGGAELQDTDRVLLKTYDGWQVTIPVIAADIGAQGNVRKGTLLQLSESELPITKAFAATDFTGGRDPETNERLLRRIIRGGAGQLVSNQMNIEALISKRHPEFISSVIGFGAPEMQRDRVGNTSVGGRIDVYLRPEHSLRVTTLRLRGECIAHGKWRVHLPKVHAAGVYDVLRIRDEDGQDCYVNKEVRGIDTAGTNVSVLNVEHALYSTVQTITLEFTYTGASDVFLVDVRGVTGLLPVQEIFEQKEIRNPCGDVLVKAPIPCFVGLSLDLQSATVDEDALRNACVNYIMDRGFDGKLSASALLAAILPGLGAEPMLRQISMIGKILLPDGSFETLADNNVLIIPALPEKQITARTVTFVTELTAISIKTHSIDDPSNR